eukprot:gb/GECG01000794.1/.p1 GENE.gb/GECG01000794.1/~~gb/GECG01000794.1/.p1  ORF type:complete len:195 (+),score=13.89 gb/GECG01000794.1/:1-585(+)
MRRKMTSFILDEVEQAIFTAMLSRAEWITGALLFLEGGLLAAVMMPMFGQALLWPTGLTVTEILIFVALVYLNSRKGDYHREIRRHVSKLAEVEEGFGSERPPNSNHDSERKPVYTDVRAHGRTRRQAWATPENEVADPVLPNTTADPVLANTADTKDTWLQIIKQLLTGTPNVTRSAFAAPKRKIDSDHRHTD